MLPTAGRYVDGSVMAPGYVGGPTSRRAHRWGDRHIPPCGQCSREMRRRWQPSSPRAGKSVDRTRDAGGVRITFERMPDRRPVETLVERDDGVVFRMRGAGGGADLPHDLVHALVEQSLQVTDGIWGSVADGVVWKSMRHVSGRQPPHAAERSEWLKKERATA